MYSIARTKLYAPSLSAFSNNLCKKDFWYALVYVFNRVSAGRIEAVGPDRACAEWLMRNGAFVKWVHSNEFVTSYNHLPLDEKTKGNFLIKEVNATNAAISYHGFPHFNGCNYVDKIRFESCEYIDNRALDLLSYVKNSLEDLEIIDCADVTIEGLKSLGKLEKLKLLKIGQLDNIPDIQAAVTELKKLLPNCVIQAVSKETVK